MKNLFGWVHEIPIFFNECDPQSTSCPKLLRSTHTPDDLGAIWGLVSEVAGEFHVIYWTDTAFAIYVKMMRVGLFLQSQTSFYTCRFGEDERRLIHKVVVVLG